MPIRSNSSRSASRACSTSPWGSAASGTRNQPNRTGRPASATLARPDPDRVELERHVDQDQLAGRVGGDRQGRLVGDLGRVAGGDRLPVETGPALDQVHVRASAGPERVLDPVAGSQRGHVQAGVLVDGEHLLLHPRVEAGGVGQDPDLDEAHGLVLGGVLLRVVGPRAQGHALHRPGRQRAGGAADRVLVPEAALDHVGEPLHVLVGVHRPDRPRHQPVVVEHPHGPEAVVAGVAVGAEGEVPAGAEPAALLLVDLVVAPDGQHGRSWSGRPGQPSGGMSTCSGKYFWNSWSSTPSTRSWSITADRAAVLGEPLASTAPYCSSVLNWPTTARSGYLAAASTTIGTSDMTASTWPARRAMNAAVVER